DRRVDIAMAGITINAEREEIIDFSNHYLDSGLRIMILSDDKSGILRKIRNFFTPGVIKGFIAMLLFILLCGQLLWISEHGKDAINDRYFPGIFESFWCVITTMTTVGYGDIAPQKWLGRIAASMVMLTGIGLFGFIIGEFTAATAIQKMENIINSPHDLARKNVATVRSTTSVKTLNDIGARVIEVDTPEDAQKLLLKKKVEAVVFDSPVLQNFVKRDIEGRLVLTGGMFDKQYYGIAFPQNSELRELVNRALLKIQTKIHGVSRFDLIYSKWFMD
ncbi:transporter substrate-binding domain-containing protein, partial [bacterium]|nr:transporter substrate-binding domain-containing protein [bacterium]